jgi:hypothetical protein
LVLNKFEKNPSGVLEGECRLVPSVSSHVRPVSNGHLSHAISPLNEEGLLGFDVGKGLR